MKKYPKCSEKWKIVAKIGSALIWRTSWWRSATRFLDKLGGCVIHLQFKFHPPATILTCVFTIFLLRCVAIKGFGKKHFGIWESRIRKTKNNFAFPKTWAPRYWILPGADVFRFCSFSFFMQILDSQWDMLEWQNCEFLLDTWISTDERKLRLWGSPWVARWLN